VIPHPLLVELRFDYGRAENLTRSGRSETIVEGDQRSLLRTFAAPHQGRGKLCGVSGAKDVCIGKFFRERPHLFVGLNFVPPGTKLPE
jgi:hypothetical protein